MTTKAELKRYRERQRERIKEAAEDLGWTETQTRKAVATGFLTLVGGPREPPKKRCGAHARSTGKPCRAAAMENGRCKLHGGMSTGPKTPEGLARLQAAVKERWQRVRAERGLPPFPEETAKARER